MSRNHIPATCLVLLLGLTLVISACSKPQAGPPPAPAMLIGIAGFTQPNGPGEMLAGYMPEDAPRIDPKVLPELDNYFETLLRQNTTRDYLGVNVSYGYMNSSTKSASEAALRYWLQVGRCMGVDLLLVPQILVWQEREGGEIGVTRPAAVVMDIFLLDVANNSLIRRSRYEERQKALADNLLDMGKFIDRGGRWVSTEQLAQEGMLKAIREFGL